MINDYSYKNNTLSNIHQLHLSEKITEILLENKIFYIRQIESKSLSELKQIYGINTITAEKIKRAFYRYQWEKHNKKEIRKIEDIKSIIDILKNKNGILQYKIHDLPYCFWSSGICYVQDVETIEDLINCSSLDIIKCKHIGVSLYNNIIKSVMEIIVLIEEGINDLFEYPKIDPLNLDSYSQPDLTFHDVLTRVLEKRLSARNIEIILEYYIKFNLEKGSLKKIAIKHNLHTERIRQICTQGLRILRFHGRIACITKYFNTVWKDKIKKFMSYNDNSVTKSQLEHKFDNELTEIYFIQNKILEIEDIWTIHLEKENNRYYLPSEQKGF